MNGEIKQEAAFAGRRVKQKVMVALALCSVIPLLVLAYVFHDQLVSGLDVAKSNTLATPIIVVFTTLLVAAGGYVIWDLASAVSRVARLVSEAQPAGEAAGARHDEIGTLMVSFNRMTVTIEQQTREIHS
jgi:methyl-accepting chemotaxis protein